MDVKPDPELEEEFNRWYDEDHTPKIATIPGWLRSRRFVLKDWTRRGVEGSKDQTPVPKWLAVHEYTDSEWRKDPELKNLFDNEWTRRASAEIIMKKEVRFVTFHKRWEKE